jgi:hypothetical protein
MNMNRLKKITYVFPCSHPDEKTWFQAFGSILRNIPAIHAEALAFLPSPETALPATSFQTGNVSFPMLILDTDTEIQLEIGKLLVCHQHGTESGLGEMNTIRAGASPRKRQNDQLLPITELYNRLQDRLIALDHTGLNIPTSLLSRPGWDELTRKLANICNLYQYPDEEWPFVIPATEEEFSSDIRHFIPGRTPKFELVYDSYVQKVCLQFAIDTDLTKQEAEEKFPPPVGFAIPGLEEIFRSVFVQNPWSDDLIVRIDLNFTSGEQSPTDWQTGEWLVRHGGRIVPT